jgi:hypothetical protein
MVVETQTEMQTHFKGRTTSFPGFTFTMVRHLAQQRASGNQDLDYVMPPSRWPGITTTRMPGGTPLPKSPDLANAGCEAGASRVFANLHQR